MMSLILENIPMLLLLFVGWGWLTVTSCFPIRVHFLSASFDRSSNKTDAHWRYNSCHLGETSGYFGRSALCNHNAFLTIHISRCVPTSSFYSSYCFCWTFQIYG